MKINICDSCNRKVHDSQLQQWLIKWPSEEEINIEQCLVCFLYMSEKIKKIIKDKSINSEEEHQEKLNEFHKKIRG